MPANQSPVSASVIGFRDYRLDRNLRCLYRNGEPLKLSRKPFDTLEFLVVNCHRVVAKAELLENVWQGENPVQNVVDQVVTKLRRLFHDEAANRQFIETVPGRGYRWIAETRDEAASSPGLADEEETLIDEVKPEPARVIVEGDHEDPTERAPLSSSLWRRSRTFVLTIAVLLASGLGLLLALRHYRAPDHIARVSTAGDTLVATGATGKVLWTYVFSAPLVESTPVEERWRTQIVDLNRDGSQEVLFAAEYATAVQTPGHARELFCFSSAGKLLWRYAPKPQFEFNTRDLNGPWTFGQVLVVPKKHASSIWVAVNHAFWWPAFLVKLSPLGTPTIMFVSSGMIAAMLSMEDDSGSYVLAGGVNNEYRAASLALIRENGAPSISPQRDASEFKCVRGCPVGKPYRYILLPRSELNAASKLPYNWVSHLHLGTDGLTVETLELHIQQLGNGTSAFYGFSPDLQPKSVAYGDNYPELHRQAEALGWIKHSFDNCPEREAGAVLNVADENGGWTRLTVPRKQ